MRRSARPYEIDGTCLVHVLPPVPRCSGWASSSLISPSRMSLPRNCRVGLHIDLFEDCSAFTRVAARTLAPSPICDLLHRRLQPFRHPMTAPVASGWSVRRVGFAPTGKRRLLTAHTFSGHCPFPSIHALFTWHWKVGPERAASVTSSGVGGVGRKLRHPANVADDVGDKSRFTFAEQRKRSGGNRV